MRLCTEGLRPRGVLDRDRPREGLRERAFGVGERRGGAEPERRFDRGGDAEGSRMGERERERERDGIAPVNICFGYSTRQGQSVRRKNRISRTFAQQMMECNN